MAIVVQKYGGSSVADIDRLRAVADQVVQAKRDGHDVVVVVSAMGKTTDNLLSLARQAALPPGTDPKSAAEHEPPRRELDMLVSTGERVSMALLSIAIQARGFSAVSFTGSQSGIITNDRHFDARIIEVRPHRIEDELAGGRIVIVAGYQGMSYRREITTLGRGGSDTTALALAAALGAERAEIYSDVDGVYSADPRVVPDARHLPEVDYATMQEMAEAGAKVLCAQAVEWARAHRVTIHARRTGDALSREPRRETIVGPVASSDGQRTVVVQTNVALLSLDRRALADLCGSAERLTLSLGECSLGPERAIVTVPLANVPNWPEVRARLQAATPDLEVREDLGVVSLVGVDVGSRPAVVAQALALLSAPSEWMASSPLRLSVAIARSELEGVARSWHRELGPGERSPSVQPSSPVGAGVSPVS